MKKSTSVLVVSLLLAALTAIQPILQGGEYTAYSLIFPAFLAVMGVVVKNLRGQAFTIVNVIVAAATNFFTSHPTPDGLTLEYVAINTGLPIVIAILGAIAQYNGLQSTNTDEL